MSCLCLNTPIRLTRVDKPSETGMRLGNKWHSLTATYKFQITCYVITQNKSAGPEHWQERNQGPWYSRLTLVLPIADKLATSSPNWKHMSTSRHWRIMRHADHTSLALPFTALCVLVSGDSRNIETVTDRSQRGADTSIMVVMGKS